MKIDVGAQLKEAKSMRKSPLDTTMVDAAPPTEKTNIIEKDVLEAQYDGAVEYLCYGDTIMLNYTKKIFQTDIDLRKVDPLMRGGDDDSGDEGREALLERRMRAERQKL